MSSTPHRPWARSDVPLIWRSDTCIEMGWPPAEVRLEGVDRDHVAWLLSLKGERTLQRATGEGKAAGLRTATMARLVRAAAQCGLLDDASTLPQSLRESPLALRDSLADDLAAARHLYGTRTHAIIDLRRDATVTVQGDTPLADVVATLLTGAGIGSIVRDQATHSGSRRHRQLGARHACHVLCDAAHPDAAADTDAMALDIPHLAVSAAGPRAVIGPLVIPGRTSCLRCRDLHLADADATWPRAAVQWAARPTARAATGLTHLAGAWAALQALALIDAGSREVQAPTIDGALVVTLPDSMPALQARPPHPLCGCRWPRTGRGMSA